MNIIPVGHGASALTLDDRQWLLGLHDLFRSQIEFLEGNRRQADDLNDRAAAVSVWRKGRFQTVRELVDNCANHGWNGTIYEAWVWETCNRVHELLATLGAEDGIAAQAIEAYARKMDYFEASYSEAMDAIDQARWLLYGEL